MNNLENKMEIDEGKYRLKYLALKELALKINSSDNLGDIAQVAVDRLIEILKLDSGWVRFFDESGNATDETISGSVEENQLLKEIEKKTLKNLRDNFGSDFVFFILEKKEIQTVFSCSIRRDKKTVGSISGLARGDVDFPSEREFLEALRNQLALASLKMDMIEEIGKFPEKEEARKKLMESERITTIMQVAVTINHEINNPLTAILGNVQLALGERGKLDEGTIKRLESIEKGAVKISEVTKSLLSIIEPVITEYAPGIKMLDLEKSKKKAK